MRPKKNRLTGWVAAILILVSAAGGSSAPGEDDADAGICEQAVWLCLTDPMVRAGGPGAIGYCLGGYAFCKKYIEPFLEKGI